MSLVRAAWERRPEGPAYLLSSVMLLYRRPVCFILQTLSPLDQWSSGGFPEFPRTDSSQRESALLEARDSFSLDLEPRLRRPGQNFFVFGCGWWYDREIVLLPPLCALD